jgi:hypothetical protein
VHLGHRGSAAGRIDCHARCIDEPLSRHADFKLLKLIVDQRSIFDLTLRRCARWEMRRGAVRHATARAGARNGAVDKGARAVGWPCAAEILILNRNGGRNEKSADMSIGNRKKEVPRRCRGDLRAHLRSVGAAGTPRNTIARFEAFLRLGAKSRKRQKASTARAVVERGAARIERRERAQGTRHCELETDQKWIQQMCIEDNCARLTAAGRLQAHITPAREKCRMKASLVEWFKTR